MNNIKQSPFLGLTGMGGGGTGLALGGAIAKRTYIDEIFNLDAWVGTNTNKTITNGIDLLGEGGLVWIKSRSSSSTSFHWALADTERGTNKILQTNSADENKTISETVKNWYNDGFRLGGASQVNWNTVGGTGDDYIGYTLRKSPGFFDCIKFTGTGATSGSPQTINHSLKSIPGMIIVKMMTDNGGNWFVYHKDLGEDKFMILNTTGAAVGYNGGFKNITSSSFDVFDSNSTNTKEFIAYVFAGGASDEAGSARSVDFDGSGDYLSFAEYPTDLNLTGDFTIEFWVYPRSQSTSRQTIIQTGSWGSNYAVVQISNQTQTGLESKAQLWDYDMNQSYAIAYSNATIEENVWTHVAFTRESGTIKVFVNGNLDRTFTGLSDSIDLGHTTAYIGNHSNSYYLNAKLSNFRIVNGTAVYTSSFRPPTKGLTNITNTKLLCCNKNTVTGSTVSPGTITSHGDPQSSTSTPFDDPAGFIFGEGGDENIIKCGTYKTNSNEDAIVDLGWEPQWVMAKRTDSSTGGDWMIYDSLRGLSNRPDVLAESGAMSALLVPNETNAETTARRIGVYSTGFVQDAYGANREYMYVAIRRPDSYVRKPAEVGTDIFNVVLGNSSGSPVIPVFTANFPVDFALRRRKDATDDWDASARIAQGERVKTNLNDPKSSSSSAVFDATTGWNDGDFDNRYPSWMWSRGAGFDCTIYSGNGSTQNLSHNLGPNNSPEMIWIKRRDSSGNASDWMVGHKDLYGGASPWNGYLVLNKNQQQYNDNHPFNNYTPTTIDFQLSNWDRVNASGSTYIAMLFSSISKISKVGSYTGNGTNSGPVIDLGFQPRVIIFKNASSVGNGWAVLDTTRGLGTSSQKRFWLDDSTAEGSGANYVTTTSTSFQPVMNNTEFNENNSTIIYYAHA